MATIVARAPLRVAFGGGGTDLPSYYREHGGFVVSTAIDSYVHMLTSPGFQESFRLKHLEWEDVQRASEVRHPILRVALERHWRGGHLEIASVGDVPPGTGLGSSGAYAVCLLASLAAAAGEGTGPDELAEAACEIEIDVLGRTVGKQDQYAAAHGGVRAYTFNPDDSVEVRGLDLGGETERMLREDCLLFFTGQARSAAEVLSGQVSGALDRIADVARSTCAALEAGDHEAFAGLMAEHWEAKRERAPGTITPGMDELRELAVRSGARGVTPLGAGGGGFVLVYSSEPERTRRAMEEAGVAELPFRVDGHGCVAVRPGG